MSKMKKPPMAGGDGDLGHYKAQTLDQVDAVKPNHHLIGAEMTKKFLSNYELPKDQIDKVITCTLCHCDFEPYVLKTLEEKIVAITGTLLHFQSIFICYFSKFIPNIRWINLLFYGKQN